MKDNVLVTGGAGYIGSLLIPELLKEGYDVTVVDNFMHRNNNSLLSCAYHPNFNVIQGDIRSRRIMEPLIDYHKVIIPLAAMVGAMACDDDPIQANEINYISNEQMFSLAKDGQRFIMPTTNSSYGKSDTPVDEDSPQHPVSQYAKEKLYIENLLMQRKEAISLRLASLYGFSPRMRTDLLLNNIVLRAKTDGFISLFEGGAMRDFVHVRDVVRAIIFCLGEANWPKMKGEIYNVGEINRTKREVCGMVQYISSKHDIEKFLISESDSGKDQDRRDAYIKHEKLAKAGFVYMYCIADGIKELIKGYRMYDASEANL